MQLIDDAFRCAKLARDAYREKTELIDKYGAGFEGLKWCGWIENPATDAQGFVVHHAENGELYCAFRGTKGLRDIMVDVKALPAMSPYHPGASSKVHSGFYEAFQSIRQHLPAPLDGTAQSWKLADGLEVTEVTRMYVTGHSLGGAVANFAFCHLSQHSNGAIKLYTFGAPPVGDSRFADYLNHITREQPECRFACRVHAPHDPVATLDSRLLDLIHAGDSLYLSAEQNSPAHPFRNHSILTYLEALDSIVSSGATYDFVPVATLPR